MPFALIYSFPNLQLLLKGTKDAMEKMNDIQHHFETDSGKVEGICMELTSSAGDGDKKVKAIQALYDIHIREYVPEITKFDRYIRDAVIHLSDSKVWPFTHLRRSI